MTKKKIIVSSVTATPSIRDENVQLSVTIEDENAKENGITLSDIVDANLTTVPAPTVYTKPIVDDPNKRGRKSRGSKITTKIENKDKEDVVTPNIILHLKCSSSDLKDYNENLNKIVHNPLEYNPEIPPEVLSFEDNNDNFYKFDNTADNDNFSFIQDNNNIIGVNNNLIDVNNNLQMQMQMQMQINESILFDCKYCSCNKKTVDSGISNNNIAINNNNQLFDIKSPIISTANLMSSSSIQQTYRNNETDNKEINQKLKRLKINLYKNQNIDTKSACFWCTFDFDTPICYILKYEIDGQLFGYGSFCMPECAVGYLMKEQIDDSSKFERYQLMNQIYGRIYNFKRNIKPAPNPFYLLDKYYGTLTIHQYRKLLKSEHLLLVIEKPITRILPELHEDTEEINIYSSSYGSTSLSNNIIKGSLNNSTSNTMTTQLASASAQCLIPASAPNNSELITSKHTTGYRVKRNTEHNVAAGATKKSNTIKENFGISVVVSGSK